MKVKFNPIRSDKEISVKFNNEKVEVTADDVNYLYDFSGFSDGKMNSVSEHIASAERVKGELSVVVFNPVGENPTEEERFPQWQTINGNDKLEVSARPVTIGWITKEELEAIENEPKPLSEADQLRLEMARSNAEMFEMMVPMMGGAV